MTTKKLGRGGSAGLRKRAGERAKPDAAGTSEARSPEPALRESERLYRLFMESTSDLAFLKDEAFRHVMVNGRYAAFLGKPVPEVLGKTDYDVMPRQMAEGCRRSDAEALAQGRVVTAEERVGETTFETVKFPVPLRGGRVGVGGFIRDITERRRAEEALAQDRFLLQALMNHVPDHVYFKDRDSRLIRISKALAQLFGVRDPAQAVGKTDFDFFTEEHARQAYEDEQAIMRTGQPVSKEERETWADRPDTWVSTTKAPLRDEAGNVVGTFGISRDITERKRAEEALATSERRFRDVADHSREWIWEVDAEGKYTYSSHIVEEILGYTTEEILQRHFYDFFHPDDREALQAAALAAFAVKQPIRGFINRTVHKSGRTVWLSTSGIPLLDEEGNLLGYRGVDADITDRKRAEAEQAELEARNRQLQKAESLSRMAGAIAHHFNNQLQAVLLNLELAKGELLPDAGPARSVTEAMMAANLAAEMSKLMLTYLGQTPGVRESLDLSLACSRWLSLLGVALPKHVGLKIDLASPGPTVRVDADQIRQVLTHLITNAWEAGGAGRSEVQVAVRAVTSAAVPLAHRVPPDWRPLEPAYACLEVVDHGCGVPEADIEKLFDPFFSSKFTGRGMGLAVVLGIVQAHGGAVTVDSTLGSGSAFRVYLPVSEGTGPVPS